MYPQIMPEISGVRVSEVSVIGQAICDKALSNFLIKLLYNLTIVRARYMRSEGKISNSYVTPCSFHKGTWLSIEEDRPGQIPSVPSESAFLIL